MRIILRIVQHTFEYTMEGGILKVGIVMTKPLITNDQMIKSTDAAKRFGSLRKKAKTLPQFITDNGTIDSVLIGYEYYEHMYERLIELEEKEEAGILMQRIERLDKNPELAVSWRDVRRSGR